MASSGDDADNSRLNTPPLPSRIQRNVFLFYNKIWRFLFLNAAKPLHLAVLEVLHLAQCQEVKKYCCTNVHGFLRTNAQKFRAAL